MEVAYVIDAYNQERESVGKDNAATVKPFQTCGGRGCDTLQADNDLTHINFYDLLLYRIRLISRPLHLGRSTTTADREALPLY